MYGKAHDKGGFMDKCSICGADKNQLMFDKSRVMCGFCSGYGTTNDLPDRLQPSVGQKITICEHCGGSGACPTLNVAKLSV